MSMIKKEYVFKDYGQNMIPFQYCNIILRQGKPKENKEIGIKRPKKHDQETDT